MTLSLSDPEYNICVFFSENYKTHVKERPKKRDTYVKIGIYISRTDTIKHRSKKKWIMYYDKKGSEISITKRKENKENKSVVSH